MSTVTFFVPGVPATSGSKRGFNVRRADGSLVTNARGNPIIAMTGDNAKEKSWRGAVASAGLCGEFFTGAVKLEIELVFVRPKAHFRANGQLKPGAPYWQTSKPDATKCQRAIEDALKGVLWRDDSQVMPSSWKRYAAIGEPCGAHVTVTSLEDSVQTSAQRAEQGALKLGVA